MAQLSEPARYAYAALFALSLNQRYTSSCDYEFRQRSMLRLLEHLKLMVCEPTIRTLMEIQTGFPLEPYVHMLSEEPDFHSSIVIFDALRWALQEGRYDARIRAILLDWALRLFGLTQEHFDMLEDAVVSDVIRATNCKKSEEEEEQLRKKNVRRSVKKYAVIGAASVGGGVLVGLTGGLVAPLIGASIGALLGTATAGTAAGAAILGSFFGAAGAGVAGYRMKKRVGDVEEFAFVPLSQGEGSRLQVTIAIPGWLPPPDEDDGSYDSDDEDQIAANVQSRLMQPWDGLIHSSEQYGLRYETKYLAELGEAIKMVYTMAASMALNQVLKMTVLHSLMAAVALPRAVLGMTSVIDNPWSVCCNRSAQVGEMLAEAMMDGAFGRRPVTLCGFSLGARVIFFCLKALVQRGEAGRGIVQDAVLIGSPVPGETSEWLPLLDVVAGRLVNAYSRNDWVLKVVYRTASAAYDIAGLQPIDLEHGRLVNVDLSDLISGHGDYRSKAIDCVKATGLLRVSERRCVSLAADKCEGTNTETGAPLEVVESADESPGTEGAESRSDPAGGNRLSNSVWYIPNNENEGAIAGEQRQQGEKEAATSGLSSRIEAAELPSFPTQDKDVYSPSVPHVRRE